MILLVCEFGTDSPSFTLPALKYQSSPVPSLSLSHTCPQSRESLARAHIETPQFSCQEFHATPDSGKEETFPRMFYSREKSRGLESGRIKTKVAADAQKKPLNYGTSLFWNGSADNKRTCTVWRSTRQKKSLI